MTEFVKRLNQAMADADMTQAELSRKTGISEASISNYRKGNYEPKHKQIYLLATALGVSPSWLMGFDLPESESELDTALSALWQELDETQKRQILDYIRFVASNRT